jgi:hypothetical protein
MTAPGLKKRRNRITGMCCNLQHIIINIITFSGTGHLEGYKSEHHSRST